MEWLSVQTSSNSLGIVGKLPILTWSHGFKKLLFSVESPNKFVTITCVHCVVDWMCK